MFDIDLTIGKFAKIKSFVDIMNKFAEDIDIIKGRYIIDAKSIMGICSLDISKPFVLRIHTDDTAIHARLVNELQTAEFI